MPQVYDLIMDEHRQMEQMLDGAMHGTPGRPELEALYRLVETHARAEEETLYVDLVEAEKSHELVLEAVEQHHVCDVLLGEIRELDPKDEHVHAKMVVLRDTLRHHFIEEERVLFRNARELMDEEWAERMAEQFEAAEDRIEESLG